MDHDAAVVRVLATVALAGMLLVNVLANVLPINGMNTGEVSDLYPSLFTPAGITFSIWAVIYALLVGFVVYSWNNTDNKHVDTVLTWFIVTCILNMSWIVVWHNLFPTLSVVIMLALLVTLLKLFSVVHKEQSVSFTEMIWIKLPFTFYLAWICVATIANISALLVAWHWSGGFLSHEGWAIVMMCVAAALAFGVSGIYRAPAFVLVVMWALAGIFIRWKGSIHSNLAVAAVALTVALAFVFILRLTQRETS